MYEYEIVKITLIKEERTREVEGRRGKLSCETYTYTETAEEFDARAKQLLNDWAERGWQAISANFSKPISGYHNFSIFMHQGTVETLFELPEFVAVLQREKQ